MEQYEKPDAHKKVFHSKKLSSSTTDIDQLCNLIDESTFGFKSYSSSKCQSIPTCQIKAFRSSRLKRLNSAALNKPSAHDNDNFPLTTTKRRTYSMDLSVPSSLLSRFQSLSTYNKVPRTRRSSSPTINYFHTKPILPSINEEDSNSSPTTQSQLSCTIIDTRRTTANSCNVAELAAYLDNFLYLPKSLSGAAELMYT